LIFLFNRAVKIKYFQRLKGQLIILFLLPQSALKPLLPTGAEVEFYSQNESIPFAVTNILERAQSEIYFAALPSL